MEKDEWRRIMRLTALVYIPIILLFVFIFLIVSYERAKIADMLPPEAETREPGAPVTPTTL